MVVQTTIVRFLSSLIGFDGFAAGVSSGEFSPDRRIWKMWFISHYFRMPSSVGQGCPFEGMNSSAFFSIRADRKTTAPPRAVRLLHTTKLREYRSPYK